MTLPVELATSLFSKLYERYREQPRVEAVERFDGEPSREHFFATVLPAGLPVVYRQSAIMTRDWQQASETLVATAGDSVIQVRQAAYSMPKEYIEARKKESVSLRDYVGELNMSYADDRPVRYAGNVALKPDNAEAFGAKPPSCVDLIAFEPPAFWLGPKGSVTPLHKDSTPNFAMQIVGRKRWLLFPVGDIPLLQMTRPSMDDQADFATSALDRNAILQTRPDQTRPRVLEVIVEPGDVLYLPAGWAHYVENLSISLMINYWMGKQYFRELVAEYL